MFGVRSICWQRVESRHSNVPSWKNKIKLSLVDNSILDACGSSLSGEPMKKMKFKLIERRSLSMLGARRAIIKTSFTFRRSREDQDGSEDKDGYRI